MDKRLYDVFDDFVPSIHLQCKYKEDIACFFQTNLKMINGSSVEELFVDEQELKKVGLYVKPKWKAGLCKSFKELKRKQNGNYRNDKNEKIEYCKNWNIWNSGASINFDDGLIRFMATPLFFESEDLKSLIKTGVVKKEIKGCVVEFILSRFEYSEAFAEYSFNQKRNNEEINIKDWRARIVDSYRRELKQRKEIYENRLRIKSAENNSVGNNC
ncbi:MAG: hypothetical protein IJX26_00770 [Clostridia bacterium]|nr:hypothetical protein [Clostridia bacterium]